MTAFRLVAVANDGHQHEIEARGDDGSTQMLVARINESTGKVDLYLESVEREIQELCGP